MNAIQNFAFEEQLVRIVMRDDEPWFVGIDVCRVLGLKKPHSSLKLLDEDERGSHTMGVTSSENGVRNTQEMIIVSEPGLYRLIFRSRKPEAERFKRWVAHDVLPSIRKEGYYRAEAPFPDPVSGLELLSGAPLSARVDAVRLGARMYGLSRGRALWSALGLPEVPEVPASRRDEAYDCLNLILDGGADDSDPRTARQLAEAALDGSREAQANLSLMGLKAVELPEEGLFVANQSPALEWLLAGTDYDKKRWMRVLRRLPGAIGGRAAGREYLEGVQVRGTVIPAHYLDLRAGEA